MKKNLNILSLLIIPAVMLAFTNDSLAASLSGTQVAAETDIRSTINSGTTSVEIDTVITTDTGTTSTSTENDSEATSTTSITTTGSDIGAGATLNITRDDVEASATTETSLSASEVSSDTQLRSYASAVMQSDENVKEMDFSEDTVAVSYEQKGHFIGLIPVTINVTAEANADGDVEVKYPWYFLVMLKNKQNLETELSNEVRTVTAMMTTSEEFNARAQAEIAARMYTTLKVYSESSTETE